MDFTVKAEKGKLVITVPMAKDPQPSATGKTLIVATSRGNQKTEIKVKGKVLVVGFNAYIKAD